MTITEAAKQYKVSRQTIYSTLKKHFNDLSKAKDKSGNLTEQALKVLSSIDVKQTSIDVKQTSSLDAGKIDALERLNAQQLQQIESMKAQIEDLKAQIEDLKASRDQAYKIADQAQQLHAADLQRLNVGFKEKIKKLFGKK